MSAAEQRRRKAGNKCECSGSISPVSDTWVGSCKSLYAATGILFCWLNRLPVTVATVATGCINRTAVDYYSLWLCWEICEVIMSHEALQHCFGGPRIEVEVDETYLSRCKYHKGHHLHSQTVTLLGIYERETNLGDHLQVRDKSSAVLLAEIFKFIEPGTRIISDAMALYKHLPEYGYEHGVVVHDWEFVKSKDRSIHTQNIEACNWWMKATVKSYRGTSLPNSYCVEYTYRLLYFVNTNFCGDELEVL